MKTFRARYDGQVLIPEEPLDLPVNKPLTFAAHSAGIVPKDHESLSVEERLRRLEDTRGRILDVPMPETTWSREEIYQERG